jgi:hypothetical protein
LTHRSNKDEDAIYGKILSGIRKRVSDITDTSILVDLLWQYYLRDIAQESGISQSQAEKVMAEIAEEFEELYDGEADPRKLLVFLIKKRARGVRSMTPDEISEEPGELSPEEEQAFREIIGDLFK